MYISVALLSLILIFVFISRERLKRRIYLFSLSDPFRSLMASSDTPTRTFTLASRGSQLAQVQTNIALAALEAMPQPSSSKRYAFKTSFMATGGDKNQSQALFILGGKSLWTKELEVALKENIVDMLVHSLKDVPTVLPEGCILGAVLKREDPVDSLVIKRGKEEEWKTLEDLPDGSVVGTSSVRRVAQLRRRFPKLQFKDVVSVIFLLFYACVCVSNPLFSHHQRGNL